MSAIATGRGVYTIDGAHSVAGFSVKHMMITSVKGSFSGVEGTIVLDAEDPSDSRVEARIDTATINTRQEQRDAHLRSADFFDVENYPVMTFKSTAIEVLADDAFRVTGDLTIRDVTREVVLNVEETGRIRDSSDSERIGYTATTKIDRTDFGLTWNQALEAGGVLVGTDIKISLDVQAVAS